jgi:hypothetical protein
MTSHINPSLIPISPLDKDEISYIENLPLLPTCKKITGIWSCFEAFLTWICRNAPVISTLTIRSQNKQILEYLGNGTENMDAGRVMAFVNKLREAKLDGITSDKVQGLIYSFSERLRDKGHELETFSDVSELQEYGAYLQRVGTVTDKSGLRIDKGNCLINFPANFVPR